MPRAAKQKPAGLTINSKLGTVEEPPKSSPMNLEGIDLTSFGGDFPSGLLDLPPLPLSPPASPHPPQLRDPSKTFLNNFKTRLATDEAQRADPPKSRQAKDDDDYRPGSSSVSKIYHLRKHPGSTPELSLVGSAENVHKESSEVDNTQVPGSRPQPSPHQSEDSVSVKRKDRGFRNPLARSKSVRRESNSKSRPSEKPSFEQAPKTAPLSTDWPSSDNMFLKAKAKEKRGKSAERAVASESEDNGPPERPTTKDKEKSGFVSGSKSVMNKAKTGGGHLLTRLGKIGRSASGHEREIPDSEYELKVINLPLVEQTRITRISKDLGRCRDKTEYWMPALPWRCIDYLNLNCESEGLYRVPGSGPQVKYWQRRFDTELDVDLLDERDLYDQNNISSTLKSWLRELPTEIFPKARQHALAEELAKGNADYQKMGQEVPQQLRDALSNLPPFNYYLLFAITCHLSLLLSHTDKNKMDLNNLSICIGPCLELERWLFNYLVGEWRHCWQGCYTEKQYLEAEKAYEQGLEYQPLVTQPSRTGSTGHDTKAKSATENTTVDERAVHSSGSSEATGRQGSRDTHVKSSTRPNENTKPDGYVPPLVKKGANGRLTSPERKPVPKRPATAQGGDKKPPSSDAINGTAPPKPKTQTHIRSQSDLPLAPIQPNEPIDLSSFDLHLE